MMSKVDIPFAPEMEKALLDGKKTMTSRYKKYGEATDWFEINGKKFIIMKIYKDLLKNVADRYKEEGFETKEDFIKTWEQLHPKKGYRPHDRVWVHEFRSVK